MLMIEIVIGCDEEATGCCDSGALGVTSAVNALSVDSYKNEIR
jgi:hypothetical protein